jgi:hypothetical protein
MKLADAPRAQQRHEFERSAYVEFLVRIEAAFTAATASRPAPLAERRAVSAALYVLVLVAPADVVESARHLASFTDAGHGCSPHDVEHARTTFLNTARSALKSSPFLTPTGGRILPSAGR